MFKHVSTKIKVCLNTFGLLDNIMSKYKRKRYVHEKNTEMSSYYKKKVKKIWKQVCEIIIYIILFKQIQWTIYYKFNNFWVFLLVFGNAGSNFCYIL